MVPSRSSTAPTGALEPRANIGHEVEMRLARAFVGQEKRGAFRLFLANCSANSAPTSGFLRDRRSNRGVIRSGLAPSFSIALTVASTMPASAPARMRGADDPGLGVAEQDGRAIRGEDADGETRFRGHDGVSFGQGLPRLLGHDRLGAVLLEDRERGGSPPRPAIRRRARDFAPVFRGVARPGPLSEA